jgi:hypothetical protein
VPGLELGAELSHRQPAEPVVFDDPARRVDDPLDAEGIAGGGAASFRDMGGSTAFCGGTACAEGTRG